MHRELVERRGWLTEDQFLRALSFCMLLPGPEAMQLATYAGWRLRGTRGGLIAGGLFVLPGAIVIAALAWAYAALGHIGWMQAAFLGIKAAVVAIVIDALLKLSRRALLSALHWALACAGFLAVFALGLPFPLLVLIAGCFGAYHTGTAASDIPRPRTDTARTIAIWGALWLLPLLAVYAADPEFLGPLAAFFSKLAVVTFGGAYAVLAYMTQTVVQDYGWITTPQMIDALGLAETTPGPLILVTEFVAILAGYARDGVALAMLAGVVALWMTFVPCFLWIFAGAPYLEWLSSKPRLTGALAAITATVVGVVASLSLWFALHVFFGRLAYGPGQIPLPAPASFQAAPALIALIAAYLILWRHWPVGSVLVICALGGLLAGLV